MSSPLMFVEKSNSNIKKKVKKRCTVVKLRSHFDTSTSTPFFFAVVKTNPFLHSLEKGYMHDKQPQKRKQIGP